MNKKVLFYSVLLLVILLGQGCQMPEVIKENTERVETTAMPLRKTPRL